MKLIVLYGPENSGKTTTLKMVYEVLKQFNLFDSHFFKYYNRDREHTDFRDVLVIDKDNYLNTKDIEVSYDQWVNCKTAKQTIPTYAPEDIIFNGTQKDYDTFPDAFFNQPKILQPNDLIRVGIVLEGDYGIPSDKKNRDLYSHLVELAFCDVIICACSILKDALAPKPLDCVNQFIQNQNADYSYVLTKRKNDRLDDWDTVKIPTDTKVARCILSHLAKFIK